MFFQNLLNINFLIDKLNIIHTSLGCEAQSELLTLRRLHIFADSAIKFYEHQVSLTIISSGIDLVVCCVTLSVFTKKWKTLDVATLQSKIDLLG